MGEVHGVNFLKRALARFHKEEIDDDSCEKIAAGEHVAEAEVNGRCDEGGEEGEHEIPEPACFVNSRKRKFIVSRTYQFAAVVMAIDTALYR